MTSGPVASDREITADLMARLEAHYLKPSDRLPSGVFLPEVGWNGSMSAQRCDALYVGFTSASGRLLVGHEVKASRSDWLNELRNLNKADCWADQCHQWWLVTVPGVVRDGELPTGWGLMLPGTSRTRMKTVVAARTVPDRGPSWDTARSIIARLNTLHRTAVGNEIQQMKTDLQAGFEARVEQAAAYRVPKEPVPAELQAELDQIRDALGGELSKWGGTGSFTVDELRLAGEWIRAHRVARVNTEAAARPYVLNEMKHRLQLASKAYETITELEKTIRDLASETLAEAG